MKRFIQTAMVIAIIAVAAWAAHAQTDTTNQALITGIYVDNLRARPEYAGLSLPEQIKLLKKQRAEGTLLLDVNFMVKGEVVKRIAVVEKPSVYVKKNEKGKIFNIAKNKEIHYQVSWDKKWLVLSENFYESYLDNIYDEEGNADLESLVSLERSNYEISFYDSLGNRLWKKSFADNAGLSTISETGNYIYLEAEDPEAREGNVKEALLVVNKKGDIVWRFPEKGFNNFYWGAQLEGKYVIAQTEYPPMTTYFNVKNNKEFTINKFITSGISKEGIVRYKKDDKSNEQDSLDLKKLIGE